MKDLKDFISEKTSIHENGMSFSFTKQRNEIAFLIELDKLFTHNKIKEKRADAIFITNDKVKHVKIIIVELKGVDLKSAIEQIESTIIL